MTFQLRNGLLSIVLNSAMRRSESETSQKTSHFHQLLHSFSFENGSLWQSLHMVIDITSSMHVSETIQH